MDTPNLDHFDEILARFHKKVEETKTSTSPMVLSQIEREATALMSELQFTAPRLWNDFVSLTQKRRLQIATGQAEETKWQPQQPAIISEPKPRKKKKTTRKKA